MAALLKFCLYCGVIFNNVAMCCMYEDSDSVIKLGVVYVYKGI